MTNCVVQIATIAKITVSETSSRSLYRENTSLVCQSGQLLPPFKMDNGVPLLILFHSFMVFSSLHCWSLRTISTFSKKFTIDSHGKEIFYEGITRHHVLLVLFTSTPLVTKRYRCSPRLRHSNKSSLKCSGTPTTGSVFQARRSCWQLLVSRQ